MIGLQPCIAILDDDLSVRTAISRLLRASRMTVDAFATYVELFNFLDHRPIDCLVLDLQMPGMNGLDVLRYIRQRGMRLPVVMITAHDGPGSRENCMLAGATDYVRKPLDAAVLLDAIDKAVGGKS